MNILRCQLIVAQFIRKEAKEVSKYLDIVKLAPESIESRITSLPAPHVPSYKNSMHPCWDSTLRARSVLQITGSPLFAVRTLGLNSAEQLGIRFVHSSGYQKSQGHGHTKTEDQWTEDQWERLRNLAKTFAKIILKVGSGGSVAIVSALLFQMYSKAPDEDWIRRIQQFKEVMKAYSPPERIEAIKVAEKLSFHCKKIEDLLGEYNSKPSEIIKELIQHSENQHLRNERASWQSEIEILRTNHQKAMDDLRNQHQNDLSNHNSDLTILRTNHQKAMDDLRNQHQNDLSNHNNDLTSLRANHQKDIEELRKQHDIDLTNYNINISSQKERHQEEIETLRAQHETDLNNLRTHHNIEINQFKGEINEIEKKYKNELKNMLNQNKLIPYSEFFSINHTVFTCKKGAKFKLEFLMTLSKILTESPWLEIEELKFYGTYLGSKDDNQIERVSLLMNCLKLNSTIKKLDFGWSNICKNDIVEIANMLKINNTLEILDLYWNGLDDNDVQLLVNALESKKSQTLKVLRLSGNDKISDSKKQKIRNLGIQVT